MRRVLTRSLLIVGIATFGIAVGAYALGMRLNLSGSIPPGVYRVTGGPVTRGTVVLVCLPSSLGDFAQARGYVPSGSCPNGRAPIGKVVAAVPGDTIDVSSFGVSVNGRLLRNTAPLQRDSEGRPLPTIRLTAHIVPADEIWLASSYSARSFDSRYFGGVAEDAIVSRIRPVFTIDR